MRIGLCLASLVLVSAAPSAPARTPQEKPLEERQAAFLASVKAGEVDEAYAALLKGSAIPEDQVGSLAEETRKGVKIYGGVAGVQNLGLVKQEKHIAFGVAIVCADRMPLFFYFVWYRKTEAAPWVIINSWFNDKSREFLEFRR